MEKSKSNHLRHNFKLPRFGRERFSGCMNVNPIPAMRAVDDHESSDSKESYENRWIENRRTEVEEFEKPPPARRSSDDTRRRVRFTLKPLSPEPASTPKIRSIRKAVSEGEDEISVTRKTLVMEYRTEVGKLKETILKNNTPDEEIPPLQEAKENSPPVISKTDQKSTCSMPPPNAICSEGDDKGRINAAIDDQTTEKKSTRPKRNLEKKEERAKFSISLSRKEIEDDFITMTGKKPPRKPMKRPKHIHNQLQALYPGSRLCEVHPDLYK